MSDIQYDNVSEVVVNNVSWDAYYDENGWIKRGSTNYHYLQTEIVDKVFPILDENDKNLLVRGLVTLINAIHKNFGIGRGGNSVSNYNFWVQLAQNDRIDCRALLNILLPFINDNEEETKKKQLRRLTDLYTEQDSDGKYVYSNSQYNRCVRRGKDNEELEIIFRPYLHEYFYHNLHLVLSTVSTIANKLYVNWVDVLPMRMDNFTSSQLYLDTIEKFNNKPSLPLDYLGGYYDTGKGLPIHDVYNVIANHLFDEIKNHKWMIYDIFINDKTVPYIVYLENKLNIEKIWSNVSWSQLSKSDRYKFISDWSSFIKSNNQIDRTILSKLYFFFGKYHQNAEILLNKGQLVLTYDIINMADDDDEGTVTPEATRDAYEGMKRVPPEEIYLFFYDQMSAFKKSWFYYAIKIAKQEYLTVGKLEGLDIDIYVTPKNIYNYCKSLIHIIVPDKRTSTRIVPMPTNWVSLKNDQVAAITIRIYDIDSLGLTTGDIFDIYYNEWSTHNWFNVNRYFRRLYPELARANSETMNRANALLHRLIRSKLFDVVFQSLIYHGMLSELVPNASISDNSVSKTRRDKQDRMRLEHLDDNGLNNYSKNAYYFATGETYDRTYLYDLVSPTSRQNWTFTYAMNWVSQINFYHRFINNRVIYVTGGTGVGKSTQVPKLLMYSLVMINYNISGKIICTQPRISPTVGNAETISSQMGVPITTHSKVYDKKIPTNNYQIQFKHQGESHIKATNSFLRIVTDGTLYEEIKSTPFLTRTRPDPNAVDSKGKPIPWAKTFESGNKYDIVIVDEAHEHNANMDMILTLMRDAVYVNNKLMLVIVSATMDDDEPIYRRYYRTINDNRFYPLNMFLASNELDRANIDRRIHISPPGQVTQFVIEEHWLTNEESSRITADNFVDAGIAKTIEVVKSTFEKDILLFVSGIADIRKAVEEINNETPCDVIALGFYGELDDDTKNFIMKIDKLLSTYTRSKSDVFLPESEITRRVTPGTYKRAVIVATNVAEASITLENLGYVIDTGFAKSVIYDPIDSLNKTVISPISWSSVTQRKGRVGRVASGVVYHLYSKEKVINNKTTYGIADTNFENQLIPLLKIDPDDSPIITAANDINYVSNLIELERLLLENRPTDDTPPRMFNQDFYRYINNPHPYENIIKRQYMLMPDEKDLSSFYLYYGKADRNMYTTQEVFDNLYAYMTNNHDDYDFESDSTRFISRCYTGYDAHTLADQKLQFYIIHPEENIIKRDLHTGEMIELKCSPLVTDAYYYYLLYFNDVIMTKEKMEKCDFNKDIYYPDMVFLKYPLAIQNAALKSLVLFVQNSDINVNIKYSNIDDYFINNMINRFFQISKGIIRSYGDTSIIRSSLYDRFLSIRRQSSVDVLNDNNNLLWYSYSIPYGLQTDVLALQTMMASITDMKYWPSIARTSQQINSFIDKHSNPHGDIYFIWKIWIQIKELLNNLGISNNLTIDSTTQREFETVKDRYFTGQKIPFDSFIVLDKMFNSGQLNTVDEFYFYVKNLNPTLATTQTSSSIEHGIRLISKRNGLSEEKMIGFVTEYLKLLFELERNVWISNYEIENIRTNTDVNGIEWAEENLKLPGYIDIPNYVSDDYDKIIESYIRAYTENVAFNSGFNYLLLSKGVALDPSTWSKKSNKESTTLNYKSRFVIYHNEIDSSNNVTPMYMTPIKLDWAIRLNPVYFFNLFFGTYFNLGAETGDESFDEDTEKIKMLISTYSKNFDMSFLNSYLDQLNDPILTKIIRNNINKIKYR